MGTPYLVFFIPVWIESRLNICKTNKCDVMTIQMKAIEQYFPVVLFIMLYKVVLTFESMDENLKCDHSKESH